MPATAGRVRMPANNRVHSSAALQTHGIWQSAIGYDPYAPNKDEPKQSSSSQPMSVATAAEPDAENAYNSFQGLLALARITGSNADNETRGSCRKCGRVGHLYFQCRNFLSLKEDKEKEAAILQVGLGSGLDKFKVNGTKELSEESSEESESSDSDADSEMERAIEARYGKKGVSKSKSRFLSKKKDDDSDEDEEEERKKRGRSKKRTSRRRSSSDTDDDNEGGKKRRKEKKGRHEDSSDEDDKRRHRHRNSRKEKRRRRSHHDSDDSDSSEESRRRHKRRHRKKAASSSSDVSDSDDSRVGRAKKQSRKISKHRRHEVVAA
ncbi:CAX-interacting protein 4-like [Papaver somniferum]|uniref:CAX-interacting protein 4-like n=1 Tax=Papaver somniferum TaxID=3469 RepID=UPI000E6FB161|nr:CAX-interacting protein 4-like [Papaver somniferum]